MKIKHIIVGIIIFGIVVLTGSTVKANVSFSLLDKIAEVAGTVLGNKLADLAEDESFGRGFTNIQSYINVDSDGDLTIEGAFSAESASTSNDFWLGNLIADDDDYLYMDASSSEYLMWDDSDGEFELSDDLTIGGYASTTGDLNTQVNLHVGGNADIDGTLNIGEGDDITKFMFGTCNIATTTIAVDTAEHINCTGATGVASGDRVFVTATSSLASNFVIQSASSTLDNIIHTRIRNLEDVSDTGTGGRSFNWMAIR